MVVGSDKDVESWNIARRTLSLGASYISIILCA